MRPANSFRSAACISGGAIPAMSWWESRRMERLAERFVGIRIRPDQSAVTAEAVRRRRTIFANHVESTIFPAAAEFSARSLLAAPLVVFNEVIGAVTFLHDSDDNFFNEDFAAKATILAGQLGSLLEATRLSEASREEQRRAEILADVAHVLHGTPDVAAVIEAIADRLRLLLRTKLVCVLLRREGPFELRAVSAETPQLANSARARHDRQTLRFAADLAQRAVAAGEPITLSIGAEVHSLGNLVSPGNVDRGSAAHLAHAGRDPGLSAAGRRLHRRRKSVGVGHRWLWSSSGGACRTLRDRPCPGA